ISSTRAPDPHLMLTFTPRNAASLSDAVWIDLLEPSEEERRRVEEATGLRLPTREDIQEIESSSRVYTEGKVAYLSTPAIENTDCVNGRVTSVGFVLEAQRLVTLRYGAVTAFDLVAARLGDGAAAARDVFLKLIEEIVENTADALEHASAELEHISHDAFHRERPRRHKLAEASEALRRALRKLGRMGDGISHVRDALLGLGRIATFVAESAADAPAGPEAARLKAVRADIASLNDYQAHLSGKVQFLLDATLGFISIEQNDVVKTLTVVSVVGVPPVVIAGIYGMNFHHMPELDWAFGYPLSIGLMVASALLPLAWFKWRGWL
ncbi:MAG TPA: magnesium transporter CorA family protein, partial [Polyangia bacterium]|nr:magnesium transporter CorA family protein [Polyangia bacterium]